MVKYLDLNLGFLFINVYFRVIYVIFVCFSFLVYKTGIVEVFILRVSVNIK